MNKKRITTIYLDDEIKNRAKKIAKEEYISFNQLLLKALREYIEGKEN